MKTLYKKELKLIVLAIGIAALFTTSFILNYKNFKEATTESKVLQTSKKIYGRGKRTAPVNLCSNVAFYKEEAVKFSKTKPFLNVETNIIEATEDATNKITDIKEITTIEDLLLVSLVKQPIPSVVKSPILKTEIEGLIDKIKDQNVLADEIEKVKDLKEDFVNYEARKPFWTSHPIPTLFVNYNPVAIENYIVELDTTKSGWENDKLTIPNINVDLINENVIEEITVEINVINERITNKINKIDSIKDEVLKLQNLMNLPKPTFDEPAYIKKINFVDIVGDYNNLINVFEVNYNTYKTEFNTYETNINNKYNDICALVKGY